MPKPQDKWFDVPDSLTVEEQGNRKVKYYNVECRVRDHKVIDIKASEEARHNVYKLVPAYEMRIKRAAIGQPTHKNMTPLVLRFDKGRHLPRPDFEACTAAIARCWEAWEAYQAYRKAPVHPEETIALDLINRGPKPPIALRFKNKLRQIVVEDEEENPDEADELEDDADAIGAGPGAGSSGGNRAPAPSTPARAKRGAGAKKPTAKKRAAA